MLNFIPFVALLFSAADALQPRPIYDGKHFMYYNEKGVPQAVTFTNKVFIELKNDDDRKAFNDNIEDFHPMSIEEFAVGIQFGVLCEFYAKEDAIAFLNKFPFLTKNRNYYPVVIWEGTEAIALQEVYFKVGPFISDKQIRMRLKKIANLEEVVWPRGGDVFQMWLPNTDTHLNVYMLANLISNDKPWFEWCRPVFRPLNGYISAHAYITSPANTNLGKERVLNIVVQVFGSNIKVREDLQPHSFRPWPTPEEHWFDAGPRTIKKSAGEHKTTYIISYPFRHLDLGHMMFSDLFVTYEESGQVKTLRVDNLHYYIPSIIEETEIDDIQPIEKVAKTPLFDLFELDDTKINLLNYLTYCALFFCISGLIFCSFPVIAYVKEEIKRKRAEREIASRNSRAWKEFLSVWKNRDSTTDWRELYLSMYCKFKKVLAQYNVNVSTVSSKDYTGTVISSILLELEKVFQKNPEPDYGRRFSEQLDEFPELFDWLADLEQNV